MAKTFLCSRTEPVVQTKAGKLRGFCFDGTYTFHGIKYADAERFGMPREVEPWDGVKDALSYGFVCPLMNRETPNGELMVPHRYWPMDEHCQYLNVWTRSLSPEAKKPVMVWLHGGGFSAGSSIEQVCYDGANLCAKGDVVVVSINHRLNILGYLDLSPFGEKYKNSGNAGNKDMVAALKWIHDNIANFGGDPENVTLFGQSGGGMKVWTLMQTPEADGLFHKGIIQSGLIDGFVSDKPQDGTKVVTAMLEELGFDNVKKLETVPYETMVAAYQKVTPALQAQGEYVGCTPIPDDFYLGDPRVIGFTEHAKTIPVMVGTVFGEFSFAPGVPNKFDLSDEEAKELLVKKYGKHTDELVTYYKKAYPDKCLVDLLYVDDLFRAPSKDFIEKKSAHKESPTYSYLFTYDFPFDGGKAAWHCSDLPFFFANTDKVPVCHIPGVSDELEDKMSSAILNFAKTGDPNYEKLPTWPVCEPGDEAVMIFDRQCEVRHNHDNELIKLHVKAVPKFVFGKSDENIQH